MNIRYEVREGVAVVTLDRPDKLNALTVNMREARAPRLRRRGATLPFARFCCENLHCQCPTSLPGHLTHSPEVQRGKLTGAAFTDHFLRVPGVDGRALPQHMHLGGDFQGNCRDLLGQYHADFGRPGKLADEPIYLSRDERRQTQ